MPDYDVSTGRARAVGTMFKGESVVPGCVERHDKKKEKADKLEKAYDVVNKRDGNRCRATGVHLDPAEPNDKQRREHHHLKGRRVRPEWRERPERICLVSAFVHKLINAQWLTVEGTDARKDLFFHWNDEFAKGRRPIVLKRWNPRALKQTGHEP